MEGDVSVLVGLNLVPADGDHLCETTLSEINTRSPEPVEGRLSDSRTSTSTRRETALRFLINDSV